MTTPRLRTRCAPHGTSRRTAPRAVILAGCVLLTACAHVPVIDSGALTAAARSGEQIQVHGSRGPLSPRQSRAVLARVTAEAPNASALERHLALEQAVAETPLYTGNAVRILRDGSEAFPAIFEAIRSARHYLLLEYYIFEDVSSDGQRLSDLLLAQRAAGVEIRVIYDGIGSINTPTDFLDRLRNGGVQLVEFNPPNPLRRHFAINSRDHRKILVADGERAILGGINLSSTYESAPDGHSREKPSPAQASPPVWHDTDVELRGPVVAAVEQLFTEHWRQQTGDSDGITRTAAPGNAGEEVARILGSSPQHAGSRYYVTALSAIRNAESRIWITAAYFVPTHQEVEDLLAAVGRGVDVRLLLPSQSDSGIALVLQRSQYRRLLRGGVHIWERDDGILHSKTMVIDEVWSAVGSSNFDQRSVIYNDEVDAIVLGRSTAGRLTANFERDLGHAHAIDLAHLPHDSWFQRLRARFWHLWEELV